MRTHRGQWIAAALAALVALALSSTSLAKGPEPKGSGVSAVSGSAAQDEYGDEQGAAGQDETITGQGQQPGGPGQDGPTQDVFTPPVVLSAEQDDAGSLPLTGAALIVPTLLGGAMLGIGLVLLYRTRRRED